MTQKLHVPSFIRLVVISGYAESVLILKIASSPFQTVVDMVFYAGINISLATVVSAAGQSDK